MARMNTNAGIPELLDSCASVPFVVKTHQPMKPMNRLLAFGVLPVVFLLGLAPVFAAEVKVVDPESARKAVRDAKPGDVVVLASGEWKDADLRLDGEGAEGNPITIRAEEPGKTMFTGASRIRLGGSHLVVSGLTLMNLNGAKADWLEFRIDSKRRANHCRVTDCMFYEQEDSTPQEEKNRWVGIFGTNNQIDHCTFRGKKNEGATLVVWLGEEDTGGHRIVANAFVDRPRLGKNGGETIRIGDSKTATIRANCLVEGNVFNRCDGETECISNKSCGNVYRNNLFTETAGTLTLRHGNDCLVEGNTFVGSRVSGTGGVRVIGQGHRIVGNFFSGLEGDGFRGAICLVNGIPDSPDHGYHQVVDVEIWDNSIFDCKEAILIGHNDVKEATLAPRGLRFEGNQVLARKGRPAVRAEGAPEDAVWKGNQIEGELVGIEEAEGMRGAQLGPPVFPKGKRDDVGVSWSWPDKP